MNIGIGLVIILVAIGALAFIKVSGANLGSIVLTNSPEIVMVLKTWTSSNGYSSIDWTAITSLEIFHMVPYANNTVQYDGGAVNIQQVITTAHANRVRVLLGFGGAGLNSFMMNNMLNNPSARDAVETNIANEVISKGYDGVDVDLEDPSYTKASVTAFTQELANKLHTKNPNIEVDFVVAGWISGIENIPALEPYITHFHCTYYENGPNAGGCPPSTITSVASQLQNKGKLSIGFYLPGEGNGAALQANLTAASSQGYGYFFWAADFAPQFYSTIHTIGSLTSTSTSSTSTTATTTFTTTSSTTTATTSTIITIGGCTTNCKNPVSPFVNLLISFLNSFGFNLSYWS